MKRIMHIMQSRGIPSHSARSAWIETVRSGPASCVLYCRTPQGVRGLKHCFIPFFWLCSPRRTPQGVRGLKPIGIEGAGEGRKSHSARSAWIETVRRGRNSQGRRGRTPQGVRGLKPYYVPPCHRIWASRTPQGVRGLKPLAIIFQGLNTGRTPQGVRGLKPEV